MSYVALDIVRFGGISDFQLSATSSGFDTEKQVTKSTLKSAKINFRAGKGLKKMMSKLQYQKLKSKNFIDKSFVQ